ncbi:MAG: hypothetical protein MJY71_01605 [Bacteroidaceae bacterium]|nr:hypothetical protein [Bacteroidaceae bacterium]
MNLFRKYTLLLIVFIVCSCTDKELREVYKLAGENWIQLDYVLQYYKDEPEKYQAALFLIKNMPAHYSYVDTSAIERYYEYALQVFNTNSSPEKHRDLLLAISDSLYSGIEKNTILDCKIITADYLIYTINNAYDQWKWCSWAEQVEFDEFCEWILPYKAVEYQSLDYWRDTLKNHFTSDAFAMLTNTDYYDDVECGTAIKMAEVTRDQINNKIQRYGLYTRAGLPILSAKVMPYITFGNIHDYALLGTLTFRSIGLPVVLDQTAVGARYSAAHQWLVVMGDKGEEEVSEWDISTYLGWGFFPYERGPKVYRNTYAIDARRQQYMSNAKHPYQFNVAMKDVTEKYFVTSTLSIPISKENRKLLRDKYVLIASAVNNENNTEWVVVDFGVLKHGKAIFEKMGREVLYIVMFYSEAELCPISNPFILHKDGSVEYVCIDSLNTASMNKWCNNPY